MSEAVAEFTLVVVLFCFHSSQFAEFTLCKLAKAKVIAEKEMSAASMSIRA